MRKSIDENGNWRSFRHRNYRILYPANAISNIGSWAQRVAQDWLVLQLTNNSGTALGIVTAVQFAPTLFFSMHGGLMADKVDKRKLLIATNALAGLASITLGLLVVTDRVQLWHVMACAAVLGISNAFDAPIRQAFTSEIVGHTDVANAVSLNSANFNAGRLVGPAVSGFLIARFDTGPSFLINGTSYIFVILSLLAMRPADFFIQKKEKTQGTIREAFAYVRARPDLYVVMIVVFFIATFGLNFQIFNALMATQVFGKGPAQYGLLGTYVAIGSLSGALLSARLESYRTTTFVMRLGIVFSIAVAALAFMPSYGWYSAFLPICGITALTTMISANSYVQTHSDTAIRGRVMGIYLTIFMGGTPFGSPFIGWLTELIGVRQTVFACGTFAALAVAITYFIFKDKVERPDDLRVSRVLAIEEDYSDNKSN
jgi:MFS family permease